MPRKPRKRNATVQVNLRIKEHLRGHLENDARKHGASMNYEITTRLERSFDRARIRQLEEIAEGLKRTVTLLDAIATRFLEGVDAHTWVYLRAKQILDPEVQAVIQAKAEELNSSAIKGT